MNAVWAFGCCWTADPAGFPAGINDEPVPVITVSTEDDERDIFSMGRSMSGLLRITTSGFRFDKSDSTFRADSPENGVLEASDSRCSIAPVDRCGIVWYRATEKR